jgi:hypothetical protein
MLGIKANDKEYCDLYPRVKPWDLKPEIWNGYAD